MQVEDTGHGNLDVGAAIACNEAGCVFTDTDMTWFTDTFLDVVWGGNVDNPFISRLIDGTPGSSSVRHTGDWIRLNHFDREVHDAI